MWGNYYSKTSTKRGVSLFCGPGENKLIQLHYKGNVGLNEIQEAEVIADKLADRLDAIYFKAYNSLIKHLETTMLSLDWYIFTVGADIFINMYDSADFITVGFFRNVLIELDIRIDNYQFKVLDIKCREIVYCTSPDDYLELQVSGLLMMTALPIYQKIVENIDHDLSSFDILFNLFDEFEI